MVRKGEEFKALCYASTAALCNDYMIIYNIIPNSFSNSRADMALDVVSIIYNIIIKIYPFK